MTKQFLFLCTLALSVCFISCGEDCVAPGFEENIIGTWDSPDIGEAQAGTVTFRADGTGTGSEDGVFWAELNDEGSGDFTWTYNEADQTINLDYDFMNGGLDFDMDIVSFDCDNTTLSFFLNFTLER